MASKIRLDELLVSQHEIVSLEIARSLIMNFQVLVNDQKITKPGTLVDPAQKIRILNGPKQYVSRGAEKLKGAHKAFGISFQDQVVLDVGISTGGFTDYCLQNGAKTVFGIDVGYGQLAMKLQLDPRVFLAERINARTLTMTQLQELTSHKRPDLLPDLQNINRIVMDLSFISCLQVLPAIKTLVTPEAQYIILVKPQFESERHEIPEGGIIEDAHSREQILKRVEKGLILQGFTIQGRIVSPIQGTKGNYEYFLLLTS